MILISSIGEFLLYYSRFFFISLHCKRKEKKNYYWRIVLCCLVLPIFAVGLHVPVGLN